MSRFAVLLVLAGLAGTAAAQVDPGLMSAAYIPSAEADSMLVLIEMRDLAEIEHDLEEAVAQRAVAEVREARGKMLQSRAETRIKIKEAEIGAIKAETEQAKLQKDEAKKKDGDARRKLAEVEKQLLKRRLELRGREIAFARAEVEYHAAQAQGFERELELAHLRAQRAGLAGGVGSRELFDSAQKLMKKIDETEGKALDAKVAAAEKQKKLAEKAVDITKARKKVYDAQRKLIEKSGQSA